MYLKIFSILILSLTLASCGGKKGAGTTKANIVVLGGIASGIPGMTGGTKIYGYNNSTGETFNMTYTGQAQFTVSNGVWGFAAITWDGVTANGNGQVLEGNVLCGTSPDMALFGGDIAINITLSNAGCNDSFFGEASTKEATGRPKIFRPNKCLSEKSIYDDQAICVRSVAESFQVQLPDGPFGGPGLISRCIDDSNINNETMIDATGLLRIPMIAWFGSAFQIRVRLYDGAGCTGSLQEYNIDNAYAGWSHPYAAQLKGGGTQGDGFLNEVLMHNDPCVNGEGQAAAPFAPVAGEYVICNEVQFEGPSGIEADLSGIYDLQNDLDFSLSGIFPGALVSGIFAGQFRGNGHSIFNVTIDATSPAAPIGLFQQINGVSTNTEVENLFLSGIYISTFEGAGNVGGLVGLTGPNTRIERVDAYDIDIFADSSTGTFFGVGGLIGTAGTSTAAPSSFHALTMNWVTIDINENWGKVGGIIGSLQDDNYLRHSKVQNLTIIDSGVGAGQSQIGGAVGGAATANTEIFGVYVDNVNIGSIGTPILSTRTKIGGLVGQIFSTRLSDNKVTGFIYSDAVQTGGLGGNSDGSVQFFVVGNITDVDIVSSADRTGGLFGELIISTSGDLTIETNRTFGSIDCFTKCGGLVGEARTAGTGIININKSYSRSNISSSSSSAVANIGGLIGASTNAGTSLAINEVFSTGIVTATGGTVDRVGGLIGTATGTTVADAFFTGSVNSSFGSYAESGALIGYQDAGGLSSSYTTSNTINADDCIGALINTPVNTAIYGVGAAGGCSTYLSAGAILDLTNLTGLGANWVNISAAQESQLAFADILSRVGETFTGTFFDPIELTSANQWNSIGDQLWLMNKTFNLAANISFSNSCHTPIGSTTNPFTGTLRGGNYFISDISCNDTGSGQPLGLFGVVGTDTNYGAGKIEDYDLFDRRISKSLYVDNVHLTSNQGNLGIIAGLVLDNGSAGSGNDYRFSFRMSNVQVTNSSVSQGASFSTGGLIGMLTLTNENSSVIRSGFQGSVTMTGGERAGGLFGFINGVVTSPTRNLDFAVLDFYGDISSNSSFGTGGIVGEQGNGTMELAYAAVDLIGAGIAGNMNTGGLAGRWTDGEVRNSYAKGTVSGSNTTGGFIGNLDANTTNPLVYGNYFEGAVSASGTPTSCFVGQNAVTPIIFNNWADCSSVSDPGTPSYFTQGAFTLVSGGTQAKNVYTGPSDEVITGADFVTPAQLYDENYLQINTQLQYGDPWFTDAAGAPRLFWEIYPEALAF